MEQMDMNIINERRNNLKNYCLKNKDYEMENRNFQLGNMTKEFLIYSENTRSLMCFAPKTGTSFWVRVIYYLRQKDHYETPYLIPDVIARGSVKRIKNMHLTESDVHKVLRDSKKFIFTRNPFERLYSLYISKLFTPNEPYMNILGSYIIHDQRNHFSPSSLKCGSDVSFTELLQYFIAVVKRGQTPDEHLELVNKICSPCQVDYDFVGKTESFRNDGVYLLHELGYNNSEINGILGYKDADRFEREFISFFRQPGTVYINTCLELKERITRFWTKMKIIGIYAVSEEVPIFSGQLPNLIDVYSSAWQSFYRSKLNVGLKKQKQEAMLAEYAKQDQNLILQLEEILKPDLEAFGYEAISYKLFNNK